MSKLGVHVSAGNRRGFGEFLAQCASAGSPVPIVFSLNQNVWADIQQYSPTTTLIYRDDRYGVDPFDDDFFAGSIQSAGDRGYAWVEAYAFSVWSRNPAHYYAFMNEPGVHSAEAYQRYNAFCIGAMTRANELGLKLCLYEWSTGNPDLSLLEHLIPSLVMAKQDGHILGLHEYSLYGPMIQDPPSPLILRYRTLYTRLPVEARCKVAITEAGPGAGYGTGSASQRWNAMTRKINTATLRQASPLFNAAIHDAARSAGNTRVSAADYTGQAYVNVVAAYDTEVMKDDVLGVALFDLGNSESNMQDALPALGTYIAAHPTPAPIDPPPPPPIEEEDPPIIINPPQWASPDGTTVPGASAIRDLARDVWSLDGLSPRGRWVIKNKVIHHDGQAVMLLFHNGKVYAVNDQMQWWLSQPDGWSAEPGDPRGAVAPPSGMILNVPYLNQLDGTDADFARGDCGPADLAMALNFYGKPVTVDQVSIATGQPAGFLFTSWPELNTAARTFGYSVINSRDNTPTDIRESIDAGRPVIALINYTKLPASHKYDLSYNHGHFLLIVGYDTAGVIYHDPYWHGTAGKGLRLSWSAFDVCWSTPNSDFTYPRQIGEVKPYVTPPPPPPAVAFVGGVGAGNPQPLTERELEALRISRVPAFKLLTLPDPGLMSNAIAAVRRVRPDAFIMARLFYKPDPDRLHHFDAAEFVATVTPGLSAAYASGVRYFEIHNEPNVPAEGDGWNWSGGGEFATWLFNVLDILRLQYPDAKWGYPGLSSNQAMSPLNFWMASRSAVLACDWIGVHSYWHDETNTGFGMTSIDGGWHWTRARAMFPGKVLYLTEFSNNNPAVGYDSKGSQYANYVALLAKEPAMAGAFAFALSWPGVPDTNREAWVVNNVVTQIPVALGARLALARIRYALEND